MDRRILVVDDSELACEQISQLLARPDRRIKVAHDGTAALEWLIEGNFSLVLTDLCMQGIDGLELIHELRSRDLPVTAIVMTGYATVDSAVEAMKLGAYDYLTKPIDFDRLEHLVDRALDDRRLRDEVDELRRRARHQSGFADLLGKGPTMRAVFDRIARVAGRPCNLLITGETGTGKELVAQAIHAADPTRRGPLVAVNCAALPEPLLESELFGHERGAFTGADRQKPGRFELARGGTLLLDEIGELPPSVQAKLLRVIQEGTFERVGGTETLRTDARILAATNLDLAEAARDGRFREDLFYRLNVVSIELPPLRQRGDDLAMLVEHFLDRLAGRGYPPKAIDRETLARMAVYDWPGNVRELEHLVELLMVTTAGPTILPEHLPPHVVSTRDEQPFSLAFDVRRPWGEIVGELTERVERAYLQGVLEKYRGRIDRCAEHAGLSRRSISEKLKRYRIDKADFKPHLRARREAEAALAD